MSNRRAFLKLAAAAPLAPATAIGLSPAPEGPGPNINLITGTWHPAHGFIWDHPRTQGIIARDEFGLLEHLHIDRPIRVVASNRGNQRFTVTAVSWWDHYQSDDVWDRSRPEVAT